MTHFCTTAVLPKCANSDGKKQTAYFFITFYNLNTCLTKVDEVIENKHLVDNYEKTQTLFRFKKLTNDPAVDIAVRQPNHGSIGVVGKTKVYRSEVDFFVRKRTSREDLQAAEHRDFYPPRFQIFLAPSPKDPTLRGGRIKLKGARSDLQYDIYLDPPPSSIIPNGIMGTIYRDIKTLSPYPLQMLVCQKTIHLVCAAVLFLLTVIFFIARHRQFTGSEVPAH
jgi:hypothetical protein